MRFSRTRRRKGTEVPPPLVRPAVRPRPVERMVFVCGLHRSGTTMVAAWLHAHARLAELRAPVEENEGQHLQDVYPRGVDFGGVGRFALAPQMAPAAPGRAAAARARDRLIACWSPWIVGDEPVLLEKSPPNLTRIAWLRAVFPGAGFVVVTRDPRAAAMATVKWTGQRPAALIRHWAVAHEIAAAAMGPDCHHVRYEDFCADPIGAAGRTVDALGLERRAEPLALEARFARPQSSNAAYLEAYGGGDLGPGIWQRFGYGGAPGDA